MAVTFGLVAFLLGEAINARVALLRRFNIPDPVTGGLLLALFFFTLQKTGVVEVRFDTNIRDVMLLVFFTSIGLNARIADLARGGRPLVILIGLTTILLFLQNIVGGLGALISGLPLGFGVALGSTSLLGGHGTMIAWSGELDALGLAGAPEAGVAMATLGLVAGAVIGGPLAKALIEPRGLVSEEPAEVNTIGLPDDAPAGQLLVSRSELMRSLLVVFLCIIAGFVIQRAVLSAGLNVPLFVPCLLVGMLVGNVLGLFPRLPPVAHTPALALLSEFALGVFLAISLMALQLWALAGMAGTLLSVLAVQTALAIGFSVLVFRILGRDYPAAVLASGYASFVIGATPTAIATMTAVTKKYGPCAAAFIVLPLVSALFVDIANAMVTQAFLAMWAP